MNKKYLIAMGVCFSLSGIAYTKEDPLQTWAVRLQALRSSSPSQAKTSATQAHNAADKATVTQPNSPEGVKTGKSINPFISPSDSRKTWLVPNPWQPSQTAAATSVKSDKKTTSSPASPATTLPGVIPLDPIKLDELSNQLPPAKEQFSPLDPFSNEEVFL
jgi:hypothetical protein